MRRMWDVNLMRDIGAGVTDVSIHLPHHSNMLVAIQERVFFISCSTASTSMSGSVRLEAGVRQYDDQPLRVLVICWDRNMLLRSQPW
jgi:hypothetical protein